MNSEPREARILTFYIMNLVFQFLYDHTYNITWARLYTIN